MATLLEHAERVPVDGATLAYVERGRGEPVVFVHGAVSDLRTWSPQLEAVAERYRAIAYSSRYARPNDGAPSPDERPVETHVDDLVALLDAIDASPAHLVGNSSGAFVCLLAAVRRPDVVRTLVLEEPPVTTLFTSAQPRPLELLGLLVRRPRTAAAVARMGIGALAPAARAFRRGRDAAGAETFLRGVLGREHAARLPAARRRQALENAGEIKATLLGPGLPELGDDDVRRVSTPTLLLVGADSPPFSARLTDRLEELLPNATRVEIRGGSHFAHEENAAAVNAAILAFLAGGRGGRESIV